MHTNRNPTFEDTLEENKDKIYRICKIYAVSPNEPEDLFQEVVIHLWQAFSSFEGRSNIDTWVYRITLNVCLRSKSKDTKRNEQTLRLDSIRFEPQTSVPDHGQPEKNQALQYCIHKLNPLDQSIVILSLDELPYKQIAKITGLTFNHIAVKMKRIRKSLLNCITSKLRSNV